MQPPFDLTGKTIFISGATGHLGQHMARSVAASGGNVLVNGRNAAKCEALCEELRGDGQKAETAIFDITDSEATGHWFQNYSDKALDGLVNNAYAGGGGTIETAQDEEYQSAYNSAVISAQRLIRFALPALRKAKHDHGDASIVNIISMYGLVSPNPANYSQPQATNPPFYGAAKAALAQFTRYSACEFGAEGLRTNAVAPGPFPAPNVCAEQPEFIEKLKQSVPMKRIGQGHEIGGPVTFLLSPAASYVNGATLTVDGGWTSW
tara:strand:- start:1863 stop:2654 length:792 start_codon:yes stop_codon:yes gene_type:complete